MNPQVLLVQLGSLRESIITTNGKLQYIQKKIEYLPDGRWDYKKSGNLKQSNANDQAFYLKSKIDADANDVLKKMRSVFYVLGGIVWNNFAQDYEFFNTIEKVSLKLLTIENFCAKALANVSYSTILFPIEKECINLFRNKVNEIVKTDGKK